MKIVFMGTPKIAVPALQKLIDSRHEVIAVITQPDQKSGRGMEVRFSPVKQTALSNEIPCYQPEKISEEAFLDFLEELQADVFAVAAYAQKIPDRLLQMGRFGCINMHPSLLPKYRGSGPLRGPILNGDEFSGVTIMQLVSAWDAGDILMQESFPMDPKETQETLERKSSLLGADLMLKTIDGLEAGTIHPVPQDPAQATYLKQITKEAGKIDFSQDAVSIERLIRSCVPWPSAFTYLEGRTFKIWEADVVPQLPQQTAAQDTESGPSGTVAYADKKQILIKTGDGYLRPVSVQIEGKKRMTMEEFLRGRKIGRGVQFG
ncbi:MAG: methionyl-tRNA formyltransferase [Parasporobacterium sp.]|nr:methionyl-tRNA formyltransferase [Parasporobacterium sp.]